MITMEPQQRAKVHRKRLGLKKLSGSFIFLHLRRRVDVDRCQPGVESPKDATMPTGVFVEIFLFCFFPQYNKITVNGISIPNPIISGKLALAALVTFFAGIVHLFFFPIVAFAARAYFGFLRSLWIPDMAALFAFQG